MHAKWLHVCKMYGDVLYIKTKASEFNAHKMNIVYIYLFIASASTINYHFRINFFNINILENDNFKILTTYKSAVFVLHGGSVK
jgi:hypothetical protein